MCDDALSVRCCSQLALNTFAIAVVWLFRLLMTNMSLFLLDSVWVRRSRVKFILRRNKSRVPVDGKGLVEWDEMAGWVAAPVSARALFWGGRNVSLRLPTTTAGKSRSTVR